MTDEQINAKFSELSSKIDGVRQNYENLAVQYNALANRLSSIENNGLESAVGDLSKKVQQHNVKLIREQRQRRENGKF